MCNVHDKLSIIILSYLKNVKIFKTLSTDHPMWNAYDKISVKILTFFVEVA